MERKLAEKQYQNICDRIANGKIKSALDSLNYYIRQVPTENLYYRLETISDNYLNLLKYSWEG